jgi:predicted ferric reductase
MEHRFKIKSYHLTGAFWIFLYILISLTPLFIAMGEAGPQDRGFWIEFSVALGFVGLTMISLQFLLIARFRRLSAPYGIDIILEFHRYISLIAVALILAHPLILFLTEAQYRQTVLNPFTAPLRAQMAWLALLTLLVLVVISLYREKLGIRYETWKTAHGLLAVVATGGALLHILGVSYYLALPWKQGFWTMMFLATVFFLLYIRIIKPLRLIRKRYFVEKVHKERGDSWTITFRPDGHQGMQFMPGQFAWLTLGNSPLAIEEHPFSFSSSATQTDRLSFTIKELGDFTSNIHKIKPGEPAYIDGPHGVFSIDRKKEYPGFVLIAGGVGITPVISMVRTMAERKDNRPVLLFYASKAWEEVTFREELEELEKIMNLQIIHVLENPPESWEGESGFLDEKVLKRHLPANMHEIMFFICGPPPMMNAAGSALDKVGIPFENIEMELFNLV